jgi:iron complex outermembrane receptor protein
MYLRTPSRACFVLSAALALSASLAAQTGVAVAGRLINSLSGDPIAGATVQLDELNRRVTSAADGTFSFPAVPAGTYHLSVHTAGYSTRRTEIIVSTTPPPLLDVLIDLELHFTEQTTVTGDLRSQFEVYQPTAVLSGQDLAKALAMSLGDTLANEPGVAVRSFGPATSRPVIRGMDGDRVQILQDGQRTSDLSAQSGDHAVSINPAAATQIDVVRGPATLLYGSSAIGGLVNVITEDIPMRPIDGISGVATFDVGSAATEGGAAADIRAGNGRFAFRAGGGGRRSGDYASPEGDVENSQARTGFGGVGLSWTGLNGYLGGSYGYDDTRQGIPVVEGGIIQTTPRRHSFAVRAGGEGLSGLFDSYRATLTARRYKHDELEGDEIGTAFKNDTEELELMAGHRPAGRLRGRFGVWILNRAFSARGAEALSPDVDQRSFAGFLYEEVTWPHVALQFAGRVDHTRYSPVEEEERSFTSGSGSFGLVFTPEAAGDRLSIAASLAATARPPAIEELYFFGLHHATFSLDIGNPSLASERALGFDLSLRWRGTRSSGEITYFRNDVRNFIFRNLISEEEFEEREEEFVARFGGREPAGHEEHGHAEEGDEEGEEEGHGDEAVSFIEYLGRDAVLQGFEAHADFSVTSRVFAEVGADYVRASVRNSSDALPRIPPFRVRGGLRYQYAGFQAGGEVVGVAKQDRVYGLEEPTDGYTLLKLFAAYSFVTGNAVSTITARLDNVTDELYRNHLSLIKDFVPEMGRSFKLLYNVRF